MDYRKIIIDKHSLDIAGERFYEQKEEWQVYCGIYLPIYEKISYYI